MKPKPRYRTETEILERIDRAREMAKNAIADAGLADMVADNLFQDVLKIEEAKQKREEAHRLRRRATRITDVLLHQLGQKLSEFRTPQLPVLDNGDRSIPK